MVRATLNTRPAPKPQRTRKSNRFECTPFAVLVDHRERSGGWRFEGLKAGSKGQYRDLFVPTREVHLVTGDYGAELPNGTRLPVVVERKSGEDLLGSISAGHTNLRKEHERMLAMTEDDGCFCCLICEASLSDLVAEMESVRWTRAATPELLLGCAASWPSRYRVPWLFAGSRAVAERLAVKVLTKAWEAWDERERRDRAAAGRANRPTLFATD